MIFRLLTQGSLLSLIWLVTVNQPIALAATDLLNKPRPVLSNRTQTYIDRSYGFTIDLLLDFQLSSEQGDLLFFQSPDRAGTVIVRPRPSLSLSTVQAVLRNGFENDTIKLTPTGAPTALKLSGAQGLAMEVEGTIEGREVHGMLAGIFGKNDQGYMILVGSVRERWIGFKDDALNVLQSFTVRPIEPGYEYERWQHRLRGKRLIYADWEGTRNMGGIYMGEYHFCSDGKFFQRSETASSDSTGFSRYTYSTGDKNSGTWSVRIENNHPLVELQHKNGSIELAEITQNQGYLLINGVPYQSAVNELCK